MSAAHASGATAPAGTTRPLGLLAVVGAIVSFSISYALVKWAHTSGSVIAFWRMVGAAVLWWVVLVAWRARTGAPYPTAATWKRVLVPAIFFGANITLLFTAVTKTSVAHSEFITSLSPLLLVPAGALLFKERPDWTAMRWGVLSLFGIVIVLFFGPAKGTATVGGDLLMIVVLAVWVGYLLTSKQVRAAGVDTLDFMACLMPLGLITTVPITLAIDGDELWPISGRGWFVIAVLTVLTGMVAHGLLAYAHRTVPLATVGVLQVGQPALSVTWAWLIVDERISIAQVPGMALVIIGQALFVVTSQRRIGPAAGTTPPMPDMSAH
ncbi:MAG TPA: DMT family transporter [Ilumatobacteraceae bacterium]|nr:DMT family transporter [Ilumatobacteraceae bacterium]